MPREFMGLLGVGAFSLIAAAFVALHGCEDKPLGAADTLVATPTVTRWEYSTLVVSAQNHEKTGPNALNTNELPPIDAMLTTQGINGWELVSSWLEPETAFPNLGAKPDFVTGIQPNVRPMRVVLVFKKPAK